MASIGVFSFVPHHGIPVIADKAFLAFTPLPLRRQLIAFACNLIEPIDAYTPISILVGYLGCLMVTFCAAEFPGGWVTHYDLPDSAAHGLSDYYVRELNQLHILGIV